MISRRFGPAVDRHQSVPGVQRDHHPLAAEPSAQFLHQFGVGYCRRADDNTGRAGVEQAGRRVRAADAAADLHGYGQGSRDRGDGRQVRRVAGMRAVKVNDVQTLASLGLPTLGHAQRVVREHRLLLVVALVQADAVAAAQVDCGYDFHASILIFRPAAARSIPRRCRSSPP